MLDLNEMKALCRTHPEIQYVGDMAYFGRRGLEIIARSYIRYYDDYLLDLILQHKGFTPEEKYILKGIGSYQQEFRFFVGEYGVCKLEHISDTAYTNRYKDLGNELRPCNYGFGRGDCNAVICAILKHTKYFPLGDAVLLHDLIKWAKDHYFSEMGVA